MSDEVCINCVDFCDYKDFVGYIKSPDQKDGTCMHLQESVSYEDSCVFFLSSEK